MPRDPEIAAILAPRKRGRPRKEPEPPLVRRPPIPPPVVLDDNNEIVEPRSGGRPQPTTAPAPTAPAAPPRVPREPGSLDTDRIAFEAAELATGPLGFLLWLDVRLVARAFPAMSPWWRSTLGAFYASGKRWLVCRAGRSAGKSSTLTRIAVAEALFCERTVPPGQRWVWPFISVSTTDARRRIVEIQAILAAVGITVTPSYPQGQPTIEMPDGRSNAIAFVSVASTIASVSGPSTIGATIDEEAKLRDRATNANPSTEILASLVQTFRARAGIRGIRCSSAWTTEGSHAAAIAEGDTGANHVARIGEEFFGRAFMGLVEVAQWEEERGDAEAGRRVRAYAAGLTAASPNVPTWVANPTISAVASREEIDAMPIEALGGTPRATYWLRENASLPTTPLTAGAGGADFAGLAEANARLCSGGYDPRPVGAPAWRAREPGREPTWRGKVVL